MRIFAYRVSFAVGARVRGPNNAHPKSLCANFGLHGWSHESATVWTHGTVGSKWCWMMNDAAPPDELHRWGANRYLNPLTVIDRRHKSHDQIRISIRSIVIGCVLFGHK